MNVIHVKESGPLEGEVRIQGSKNAVLPILAATILINDVCVLKNCPRISDVECMLKLLKSMGCNVRWEKDELIIDTSAICESRLPKELVTCMRSSVMLLGPLLSICKETIMNYPGGCVIGERPIDIHLYVLEKLGASFVLEKDSIKGSASLLTGAEITLRFPSVGATENGILAAVLAEGKTVLNNCAREPEIQELCRFLNEAGADIQGIGSNRLTIRGAKRLHPVVFDVESDRIVAGTYLLSVAALGGEICLLDAPTEVMGSAIDMAKCLGCQIGGDENALYANQQGKPKAISYCKTMVYPGFPTDLQSILLAVLSVSDGESIVEESIFSDRFRIVNELVRMGADIRMTDNRVFIKGVNRLEGRNVVAEDLRGGAALVLAGLLATGDTFVNNCYYIERGYEDIVRDFKLLGASMEGIG